nr:META domain-containing protein [uncultured Devosia sp.]
MLPRSLLTAATLALLSTPAFADGGGLADLVGTSWRLTQLDGQPVAPNVGSTLIISADSVGGNGGCNTYGGDLAQTPDGIDISQVFSTMMACDGLDQEQAFFAALDATDAYALVDGDLRLLGNGTVLAQLAPAH